MIKEVKRNYLEIKDLKDLNEGKKLSNDYSLNLVDPIDFQLNKFFYKNIGNSHEWIDRLTWSEEKWINYVSSENVKTYILKHKNDLAGFFELIFHLEKKETEIAYFGVLKEYQNEWFEDYSPYLTYKNVRKLLVGRNQVRLQKHLGLVLHPSIVTGQHRKK